MEYFDKLAVKDIEGAYDRYLAGIKAVRERGANIEKTADEGGAKLQARKKSSQGIYSSKSIDDYTRTQYNNYGWVVINKVLTVNELNRFYKQFANKEMLDSLNQKSIDGYYMIYTGDISMYDSKIVFCIRDNSEPIY